MIKPRCDRVSFVNPSMRCDRPATLTGRCAKHSESLHAAVKDFATGAKPKKPKALSNDTRPDWKRKCEVCGQSPIVPFTGLCGPCTFGEADTAGGNW